jgi:HupE / UreJ protein
VRSAAAATVLLAAPALAWAHQAGLSYADITVQGARVDVSLRASAAELALAFPALVPATRGAETPLAPASARGLLEMVSVARAGAPCALEPGEVRAEPPDGLRVAGTFTCPGDGPLQVRMALVDLMPPGHTLLAKATSAGRVEEHAVRAGRVELRIDAPSAWWTTAARFVALGVEHIFTGPDHLAFLLGLLLATRGLREIARVVTSFTAAHSLTLALAALGVVAPPASAVEPLIAASIVWVAVENLLSARRGAAHPGGRWRLAFAFGLVHGFGFAGALAPLGLERARLAASLVAFNLGVEAGQLAFVLALSPLLALLRRTERSSLAALRAGSLAVGSAGVFWLATRLAPA